MRFLPALLLLTACNSGELDVRQGDIAVTATLFTCSGTWPRAATPCNAPDNDPSVAATVVSSDDHTIEILISQTHTAVDAGESSVTLRLDLDDAGVVTSASATEHSTAAAGVPFGSEDSTAVSGWVLPVQVSRDGGVESGQLHVDFDWGSFDGTYDTAAQ